MGCAGTVSWSVASVLFRHGSIHNAVRSWKRPLTTVWRSESQTIHTNYSNSRQYTGSQEVRNVSTVSLAQHSCVEHSIGPVSCTWQWKLWHHNSKLMLGKRKYNIFTVVTLGKIRLPYFLAHKTHPPPPEKVT